MFTEKEIQHLKLSLRERIAWTTDRLATFPATYQTADTKARYKAFKQALKELQALEYKLGLMKPTL